MSARPVIFLLTVVACLLGAVPGAIGTAQAACPKGEKVRSHRVEKGETLSGIALKEGVSTRSIQRANPKVEPTRIRPGQELRICTAPASKQGSKSSSKSRAGRSCGGGKTIADHEVKKGETLSKISSRYGVSEDAIVRRNAALKKSRNSLRVGQHLVICADKRRSKASKSCGYRSPVHRHRVIPGEHAAQIAGRYGVTRRELYRLNPKLSKNPNLIRPNQHILVCPNIAPRERTKFSHAIQSGETFGAIARRYKLTRRELEGYQQGRLGDKNALRVGQELVVWRDGAILPGFGAYDDDTGVLKSGIQLPPGRHYVVKHPTLSWGSSKTIRLIQTAVSRYRGKVKGGPKIHVGDISRRGGGKFPPHLSHQHGRDVDVGYVLTGAQKDEVRFRSASSKNLDLARTWRLIRAFLDTQEVKYIFMDRRIQKLLHEYARSIGVSADTLDVLFQYPRGRSHGIIRHSRGHVNHFHVRFYK